MEYSNKQCSWSLRRLARLRSHIARGTEPNAFHLAELWFVCDQNRCSLHGPVNGLL